MSNVKAPMPNETRACMVTFDFTPYYPLRSPRSSCPAVASGEGGCGEGLLPPLIKGD